MSWDPLKSIGELRAKAARLREWARAEGEHDPRIAAVNLEATLAEGILRYICGGADIPHKKGGALQQALKDYSEYVRFVNENGYGADSQRMLKDLAGAVDECVKERIREVNRHFGSKDPDNYPLKTDETPSFSTPPKVAEIGGRVKGLMQAMRKRA